MAACDFNNLELTSARTLLDSLLDQEQATTHRSLRHSWATTLHRWVTAETFLDRRLIAPLVCLDVMRQQTMLRRFMVLRPTARLLRTWHRRRRSHPRLGCHRVHSLRPQVTAAHCRLCWQATQAFVRCFLSVKKRIRCRLGKDYWGNPSRMCLVSSFVTRCDTFHSDTNCKTIVPVILRANACTARKAIGTIVLHC